MPTNITPLSQLPLSDDFMFGEVMRQPKVCQLFLESLLGKDIARIEYISKQEDLTDDVSGHGIRLDVYLNDAAGTHYDIEMQKTSSKGLERRIRYYQGGIDRRCLGKGLDYTDLPESYVIFVCDFDPFGEHLYCYTFGNECRENTKVKLDDGSCTIFLSTKGENEEEVPPELVRFLKFVTADLEESEEDFQDELVKQFQETIRTIKTDRKMGEQYMIFEEMLREEKQEGRIEATQEAVLDLLEDLGELPNGIRDRIAGLENLEDLKALHKIAARADSLRAFEENMEKYLQERENQE